MAAVRYAGISAAAKNLIKKYGRECTHRRYTDGVGATDWEPGVRTEDDTAKVSCVFLDFKSKDVDGTRIKAQDKKILIAGDKLDVILLSDIIIEPDGTTKWAIVNVKKTAPNIDEVILHEVQGRKA
jgi:hypothetical protein